MRTGFVVACTILGVGLVSAVAASDDSYVDTPPPTSAVCPAIEEDFDLCSDDLLSGNCRDFVEAARALGRLYRFNAQREPDRENELRTTVWWECGTRNLGEIAALLARVGSPEARSVLQSEPYRSLSEPGFTAVPSPGPPAPPVECDALTSDSDRDACEARELAALKKRHEQLFEACRNLLPGSLQDELAGQERAWRMRLEAECDDPECLSSSIRHRDDEIQQAFPQCGPSEGSPAAETARHQAKTGMLPARWTPVHGPSQEIPFSFESETPSRGRMSTTLGDGGEMFHGSYLRLEAAAKDDLVVRIYDGWSGSEWEAWQGGPEGEWAVTGITLDAFTRFYSGRMVATLDGNQGHSMRCQFRLNEPRAGLTGGGTGICQVSDGGRLSLRF